MPLRLLLLLLTTGLTVHMGWAQPAFLIKDIYPGVETGAISEKMVQFGNAIYFVGQDPEHGRELWKCDGSVSGTKLVKDINPGKAGSDPVWFTVTPTGVYFQANDGQHGSELWKTDGTTAGTYLVKEITPGPKASPIFGQFQVNIKPIGNVIYFPCGILSTEPSGEPVQDRELWRSDGTAAGTVLVKDIRPGKQGSNPTAFNVLNKVLYFLADAGDGAGYQLWKSDGTGPGTVLVKKFSGEAFTVLTQMVVLNNSLYILGKNLWKSDGTTWGTVPVTKTGGQHQALTKAGNLLFYYGYEKGTITQLWRSDGTPGGTLMIKKISPTGVLTALTPFGNQIVFWNKDPATGSELWKSDGTTAGTVLIKDISPGTKSTFFHDLSLGIMNSYLYFDANDGIHGPELWRTDGTVAGTKLVQDISLKGVDQSQPHTGIVKRTRPIPGVRSTDGLFFIANDGTHGQELFRLPFNTR